jgi:SAM-dependent methyltransferase
VHEAKCFLTGDTLVRYECSECGVIFGPLNMLGASADELRQKYLDVDKVLPDIDSVHHETRTFMSLSPSKGSYLNFGCGCHSSTIARLRANGWNVVGYDAYLPTKDFMVTDRVELSGMRFDGIFSNNLLEHLQDPVATLLFMKGLLKPGGRMAHSTPCYRYCYEWSPLHLFFFEGNSVEALCNAVGLGQLSHTSDHEYINKVFA